jgi:hypothetical protein
MEKKMKNEKNIHSLPTYSKKEEKGEEEGEEEKSYKMSRNFL